MGKSIYFFIDLLSVADDSGRVQATFRDLSRLNGEPVSILRRQLKRLRDYEFIVVQRRGNMIIAIHPNYVISPKDRANGGNDGRK